MNQSIFKTFLLTVCVKLFISYNVLHILKLAQSVEAVKYTNCISSVG